MIDKKDEMNKGKDGSDLPDDFDSYEFDEGLSPEDEDFLNEDWDDDAAGGDAPAAASKGAKKSPKKSKAARGGGRTSGGKFWFIVIAVLALGGGGFVLMMAKNGAAPVSSESGIPAVNDEGAQNEPQNNADGTAEMADAASSMPPMPAPINAPEESPAAAPSDGAAIEVAQVPAIPPAEKTSKLEFPEAAPPLSPAPAPDKTAEAVKTVQDQAEKTLAAAKTDWTAKLEAKDAALKAAAEKTLQSEKRAEDLKKTAADLEGRLAALQKDNDGLRDRLAAMERAAAATAKAQAQAEQQKQDAAKAAAEMANVKPALPPEQTPIKNIIPEAPPPKLEKWVLKSARPGSALLASKETGNLKPAKTGDVIEDLGTIKSIALKKGRWVVTGTEATIRQ